MAGWRAVEKPAEAEEGVLCTWMTSRCCGRGRWCHPMGVVRVKAGKGRLAGSEGPCLPA